jgi:hypothetical protein
LDEGGVIDVQGLRQYVRDHLELDEADLPDQLLNVYLQEAFDRTMAFTNEWPRNEAVWSLAKVPGTLTITLPADVSVPGILSVVEADRSYKLVSIVHENAEYQFGTVQGEGERAPMYYSLWMGQMYLWPLPGTDQAVNLTLRGYRQPVWDNAASAIPDLDPRLHVTLCYFAMALVHAGQEDEVMEGVYLARWQRDLTQQLRTIMQPVGNKPLVMHGGSGVGGYPSFVIVPPLP